MKAALMVDAKANESAAAQVKFKVFGLLKRGGKVYTKIIADASSYDPDADY